MGVRYQLITKDTDYLITLERNADEKATSLPELRVVPQMLPAGWGVPVRYARVRRTTPLAVRSAATCLSILLSQTFRLFCAGRRVIDEAPQVSLVPSPYVQFLRNLETHASRSLFRILPGGRKGLAKLGLPAELRDLIEKLVRDGCPEHLVLLALYAALIEHDGHDDLGEKTAAKAVALIGKERLKAELVTQFIDVLNRLWRDREQSASGGQGRCDVPAFLRMRAG